MRSLLYIGFFLLLLQGCSDDGFPVPPASTVPSFSYTLDNDEYAPATAKFTNTSIVPGIVGTASFFWNFGDGSSSTESDPEHAYSAPGVYTVNLVVTTSTSLEVRELSQELVVKDPNATGTPILFTDGSQVFQGLLNTQPPIFTVLPNIAVQDSYGMALDTINSKLYISDYEGGAIYRADLNGDNFEAFRTGLDGPNGLAIDYAENQIYWDTGNGIQRGILNVSDATQLEDFVTGQANDPEGIAIDVQNRKLYWVNYNGGIWSKNLDGSAETELIPEIEGGSIMVVGNRIYYDEYVESGDIRLKSADLNGANVTTIAVNVGRVIYGLAYDPNEQKIYWGDRGTDVLMRANLDGSNPEAWYQANADTRGIVISND